MFGARMRKEMTMAAEKLPKETGPSQKGAETGDDDREENGEEGDRDYVKIMLMNKN